MYCSDYELWESSLYDYVDSGYPEDFLFLDCLFMSDGLRYIRGGIFYNHEPFLRYGDYDNWSSLNSKIVQPSRRSFYLHDESNKGYSYGAGKTYNWFILSNKK